MLKLKKCKNCGKEFMGVGRRNIYCSKKCFRKVYDEKNKEEKYPEFICPKCNKRTKLDFNPKLEYPLWKKFNCPECHYSPILELTTS